MDPEPSRKRFACSTAARSGSRNDDDWVVNEWAKKAILLYFRLRKVEPVDAGPIRFLDKIR